LTFLFDILPPLTNYFFNSHLSIISQLLALYPSNW